jgi:hypothetical protein
MVDILASASSDSHAVVFVVAGEKGKESWFGRMTKMDAGGMTQQPISEV